MSNLVQNDQLILVSGESSTGKSASLRNLPNPERWMFLNAEPKRLPFQSKFETYTITDPYQVIEGLEYVLANPDKYDGVIIDTLTFLMNQMEAQYVNTQAGFDGWKEFRALFEKMMTELIPKLNKPVIILAHTRSDMDEKTMRFKTSVPIKGSLKNEGVEAFFSTVVSTKVMSLEDLEPYKDNGLLHITEEDEALGFKHVFQTKITKATTGERIRSPMGLFTTKESYMDNDVAVLLDHLKKFYNV